MSHLRPTLAALIGAAALTASGPAEAGDGDARVDRTELVRAAELVEATDATTLRTLIEQRADAAQAVSRHQDIDALTTLWLTLQRRGQLDRTVDRGEQFLNVALRNQRRSELRSEARAIRRGLFDGSDLERPAVSIDPAESLDAERFVELLDEPYRSAVRWSLTGRNHREVAEQMGASHAAVRKWAQRLRERIASEPEPD